MHASCKCSGDGKVKNFSGRWSPTDAHDLILILLGEILAGTLFFGIIFVLALGFPVAYTLAGTSLMVAAVGWYFEVFDFSNFGEIGRAHV